MAPCLLRPWGEWAARFPSTHAQAAMTGDVPGGLGPTRPPLRAAADAGTRRPARPPRSAKGMPPLLGEGCGWASGEDAAFAFGAPRAAAQSDNGRNRTRSCRSGPPVRHVDSSTVWVSRSPKAEARAASSPLAPRPEQARVRPAPPSQKDGAAARADGPAAAGQAPGRPVRPSSLPATSPRGALGASPRPLAAQDRCGERPGCASVRRRPAGVTATRAGRADITSASLDGARQFSNLSSPHAPVAVACLDSASGRR